SAATGSPLRVKLIVRVIPTFPLVDTPSTSWPGLSRPSTPLSLQQGKTWMPGTRPGMTNEESCLIPERLVVLGPQRAEHRLRVERQLGEAHAAGILDGVGDGRRHAEGRGLADAFGAEWTVRLVGADRLVLHDRRYVENARNLVVGE